MSHSYWPHKNRRSSYHNLYNRTIPTVLCMLIITSGCSAKQYMWGAPKPYDFTAADIQRYHYSNGDFRKKYDSLVDANALDQAKLERNAIIADLIRIVDANYFEYETAFREGKVAFDLWGDFVQLGLTTGVTLAGTAGLKTILGAAATAVKGFDLAVNQRLFQERGVQALELQMRASRDEQQAVIVKSMHEKIADYPLDMGLSDITKYYYEGTLTRALQKIIESAQASAAHSKDTLNKARADPKQPGGGTGAEDSQPPPP